jgi:hypothetical protein
MSPSGRCDVVQLSSLRFLKSFSFSERTVVFTETAPALQHLFPNVSFIGIHFLFVTDLGASLQNHLICAGQHLACLYALHPSRGYS